MKRFNQNSAQTKSGVKAKTHSNGLSKPRQSHYIKVGAAIFAVIVLHFVSQFIFLRNENLQIEETTAKVESRQPVEIKSKDETVTPNFVNAPPVVVKAPAAAKPEEKAAPSRTAQRKKEPRESRAERLRRAERILTGV